MLSHDAFPIHMLLLFSFFFINILTLQKAPFVILTWDLLSPSCIIISICFSFVVSLEAAARPQPGEDRKGMSGLSPVEPATTELCASFSSQGSSQLKRFSRPPRSRIKPSGSWILSGGVSPLCSEILLSWDYSPVPRRHTHSLVPLEHWLPCVHWPLPWRQGLHGA